MQTLATIIVHHALPGGSGQHRGGRSDEQVPGSGLGLAIVRDLARLYGGDADLGESRSGGLRVTLTLPEG